MILAPTGPLRLFRISLNWHWYLVFRILFFTFDPVNMLIKLAEWTL